MESPASPLPRRGLRTWLRRLTIVVLLILLIGGLGVWYYYATSVNDLAEAIAELDRREPGWRVISTEDKRTVLADADNSALHLLAICATGLNTAALHAGNALVVPPQIALDDQQAAALEQKLGKAQKSVLEARKLKDMPRGRFPSDAKNRLCVLHIGRLLGSDALRRAQAGDADGALESCLAIQHAARSLADDPSLMSLMIRAAGNILATQVLERSLAQGRFTETSAPAMERLQSTFAQNLNDWSFATAIRGERAFAYQMLDDLEEGKIDDKVLGVNTVERALIQYLPGYLTGQRATSLHYYNEFVDALKSPSDEAEARLQALKAKAEAESSLGCRGIVYLLGQSKELRRHEAKVVCAMAALGAERFRLVQKRWPDSLEGLVQAGYLDAVPIDPFDGTSLRLKRLPDGIMVYSSAVDHTAKHGNTGTEELQGDPVTNVGFRLWDVDQRRQPSQPKS